MQTKPILVVMAAGMGSRTLLIYMLHQPVIYGALLGLRYLGFV